jgi:prophage regulatory protein
MTETYLSDLQLGNRYGVHRSTIWRWINTDDQFPQPVNLSPGCTRWKLSQIESWENSKSSAA